VGVDDAQTDVDGELGMCVDGYFGWPPRGKLWNGGERAEYADGFVATGIRRQTETNSDNAGSDGVVITAGISAEAGDEPRRFAEGELRRGEAVWKRS